MKKDLIIIGAGLSGLYAAYLLQNKFNITILEARDRIGGRVLTINGNDLGPSWVWDDQININKLIEEFGLKKFPQYTKGDAVYETKEGIQKFVPDGLIDSYRIEGGIISLIKSLSLRLNVNIKLQEEVKKVSYQNNHFKIETSNNIFESAYVISTLPPRLVTQSLEFNPPLDSNIKKQFDSIHTWMAHSAKCIVEFEQAFWKDRNLSGFVFSNYGPLGEIQDASTKNSSALVGFFHEKAIITEDEVKKQLIKIFGEVAKNVKKIYILDWREERYTSTKKDRKMVNHPEYGICETLYDDKFYFIGTETSFIDGGYLEGAVMSALYIKTQLA